MQKFLPHNKVRSERELKDREDDFEETRLTAAEQSLERLRLRNELIFRERTQKRQ